jgi:hypothetical protein
MGGLSAVSHFGVKDFRILNVRPSGVGLELVVGFIDDRANVNACIGFDHELDFDFNDYSSHIVSVIENWRVVKLSIFGYEFPESY